MSSQLPRRDDEVVALLSAIDYFEPATPAELAELAAACRWIEAEPGETLFTEGEPSAGLYLVVQGRVRAVRYSAAGRELVVREFVAGETFNEVGALESGINPASAIVVAERTRVLLIPTPALRRILAQNPAIDLKILQGLANKLHFVMMKMSRIALLDVRARLIAYLLEHADEAGQVGPISQETLAAQLGTVRQVIGRALADLQRQGVIQVGRAHLRIVDRTRLSALLSEESL